MTCGATVQKFKKILLYIVGLYFVLFGFILPFILEWQVPKIISKSLNAEIAIENISFNPFTWTLHLEKTVLKDKEKKKLLSFDKLILNLEPHSLLGATAHIKAFAIVRPKIYVVLDEDKNLNFAKLLKANREEKSENQEDSKDTQTDTMMDMILEHIAIIDGSLMYEDYSIGEKFDFSFHNIGFELKNINTRDFTKEDATLRLHAMLEDGGFIDIKTKILSLSPFMVDGDINFEASRLYTQWRYLKDMFAFEIANGKLSFNANYNLSLEDLNNTEINNVNISLESLRIKPKDKQKDILNLKLIDINNITLKPFKQEVAIDFISVDGLQVEVKTDKNGNIDWVSLLEIKSDNDKTEESKKDITKEPKQPFLLQIEKFILSNSSVGFEDGALEAKPKMIFDNINMEVNKIDSQENTTLDYALSMRINQSGTLVTDGKLRHTPLKQEGNLTLNRISVKEINPYLQEFSYLSLDEGYINLDTKINYEQSKTAPDLKLSGAFGMEDIFIKDRRDNGDLLSINNLKLEAFDLEMFPNRFYIDTVELNAFYINALIDKTKILNLSTLMKEKKESVKTPKTTEKKEQTQFPFKVAKVQIKNSSAKFADFSLPIKFQTHIHDLDGTIYTVSNTKGEPSVVDIKGEVDKYGVTTLKGSIDSSNPKTYTDLKFDFRNLELNSVSGYSASFAGHKIDDGKLFLGLQYHIVDSQMKGDNSVIIKKIKLGDSYKDENTTSLPLGFVIALLEDSDGVIDIDLPIVGDVDNPDFKYGTLVWQTISNLVVKAVTSPFRFLSEAMGLSGEELDSIEFEAGEFKLLPPEKEKLDNIAKMLIKRPKIVLNIETTYEMSSDKQAIQFQKLLDLVVEKSDKKNIEDKKSAITVEILTDIYKDAKDDNKLEEIAKNLSKNYNGEAYRIEYLKALVKECSSLQEVTKDDLETLAKLRGEKIEQFLIKENYIDKEKIKLLEIKEIKNKKSTLIKTKLELDTIKK